MNEWEGMEKSIYQWRYFLDFGEIQEFLFAIFSFLNSREKGFLISGKSERNSAAGGKIPIGEAFPTCYERYLDLSGL